MQVQETRKSYGIFDAFGDFGGIKEVMILIAAFFLNPLNSNLQNI